MAALVRRSPVGEGRRYHVREFAALSGVTVRALHHYDRLGLLRPARTDTGYRVYGASDFQRLEQIVALKFLGLPLKDIKTLLDRDARELADVLAAQRTALEDKRRHLDRAIDAIRDAERVIDAGAESAIAAIRRIIEVIEMESSADYLKKYYSDEAWAKLAERREQWSAQNPNAAEQGTQAWLELFRDVEAALDEDPASPRAQALVQRWTALVESFTGRDPGITAGLRQAWQDQANWPAPMQELTRPFKDRRIWDFIDRAMASVKPTAS